MISTVILVHAEFDIARGCKMIRAHVAAQDWKPTVGARASAALTALGDLILNSDTSELVSINLAIINTSAEPGIQFGCNLYLPNRSRPQIQEAWQRLERATDALDVYETGGNVQISAHLCIEDTNKGHVDSLST